MPFAMGAQGTHDDSSHQGSAKRAVANGVASLDAAGKVPVAEVGAVELTTNKNAASGYAGLDASSHLTPSQVNHFVVQNVVTGSRVPDATVYHNTSDKPMFVNVSCANDTAGANMIAVSDAAAAPTTYIANVDCPVNGYIVSLSFIILPGNYYYVFWTGGTPTLNKWVETV